MIILLDVLGLAVLWTGLLAHGRVRRLHRLHQRLDAARAGLDRALARRTDVAARAGVRIGPAPDRETAANALARDLSRLDRAALAPALHAELAESEALLTLARHVHNEAVRDTLVLRARRLVRWLRLAGTAPMPAYFETVDTTAVGAGGLGAGGHGVGAPGVRVRSDHDHRVGARDGAAPPFRAPNR